MTKETLLQRLDQLNSESKAKFGILTPQHMVEHLTITLKLSAGRIPIPEFEPNENSSLESKHYYLRTSLFRKELRRQAYRIPYLNFDILI